MTSASTKSTLPLSEVPPIRYNHAKDNITKLLETTRDIESSQDIDNCTSKSKTRHSPAQSHQQPAAVLYPKTTFDVSRILKACHERDIAVTSFGGGTSLGGALAATRGGICIDFKHMDSVIEIHEDDLDVVVQPNVGWVELNQMLEGKSLFFPPDPAPGAKIGGMVSHWCITLHQCGLNDLV